MQDIIETCFRHHDMYHFWSQYEKRGCHAAAEYRNARRDGSLIQCPACFDYFAPYPEVERNTSHLISEDKVVWLCGECFVRKALPEEREIARNSPAWQQKLKESQDLEKEFIEAIKNEETLRVYVKDAFEDPAHYEQVCPAPILGISRFDAQKTFRP